MCLAYVSTRRITVEPKPRQGHLTLSLRFAKKLIGAADRSPGGEVEQRLRQRAARAGEGFEDREVVGAVDRQQMARQLAFDPGLAVVDRLAAQFGQFGRAIG